MAFPKMLRWSSTGKGWTNALCLLPSDDGTVIRKNSLIEGSFCIVFCVQWSGSTLGKKDRPTSHVHMVKDPAINIHICTHRHRPIYTDTHIISHSHLAKIRWTIIISHVRWHIIISHYHLAHIRWTIFISHAHPTICMSRWNLHMVAYVTICNLHVNYIWLHMQPYVNYM